jgi:hypothetical protein
MAVILGYDFSNFAANFSGGSFAPEARLRQVWGEDREDRVCVYADWVVRVGW